MMVKKVTYFGELGYLNSSCLRKSIILMFWNSSRDQFTLLYQNSVTDVCVMCLLAGAHMEGHQHGVSIQISINLGKKFLCQHILHKKKLL